MIIFFMRFSLRFLIKDVDVIMHAECDVSSNFYEELDLADK